MKTAMQELIEKLQEQRETGNTDLRTSIHFARQLVDKERKQIEAAVWHGLDESSAGMIYPSELAIEYYNKTFND